MNQVGIGQIRHAKKATRGIKRPKLAKQGAKSASVRGQKTNGAQMSKAQLQDKTAHESSKEGQLAVDILQTGDEMLIICPIAGVEKSDINVAIQDDVLTIRGERKAIPDLEHKQALVKELFWGTFSRSIVLPDHIDRKNIQARVHEHMLIISIPKTEDFRTRIIHINDEA